jgi:phosphoribosylanthranilate isomerase
MTNVKICGVTTEADARACLEAGADYIGLIFAESERRVTRARAAAIREAVPEARIVGVFAGHDAVQISEISRLARLDLLQLHGGEPLPLRIAVKERTGLPVARVVHAETILEPDSPFADDSLLYDLPKGRPHGADELAQLWEAAAQGAAAHQRVFLAGGLTPDNAAEAVRAVRPYAVDVSRGVESAPGVKDLDLVRRFIEEVRGA